MKQIYLTITEDHKQIRILSDLKRKCLGEKSHQCSLKLILLNIYCYCWLTVFFFLSSSNSGLEAFIRSKYEQKKYIAHEWIPPRPRAQVSLSSCILLQYHFFFFFYRIDFIHWNKYINFFFLVKSLQLLICSLQMQINTHKNI